MIIKKRRKIDFDLEGFVIILAIVNAFGIIDSQELSPIIKVLLLVLCVGLAWATISAKKYYIQKKKISKIKWAREYLNFACVNKINFSDVDEKYHFDKEQDEPYVTEILSKVKNQMEQQFFKDTFPLHNETHKLSDEEFVMLYLHSYLYSLSLKDKILDLEMIKYSHQEDKYTIVYTLTVSGYAFYKLLYTIEAYCESDENIMKTGLCCLNTHNNKKVLNSGTYISYKL